MKNRGRWILVAPWLALAACKSEPSPTASPAPAPAPAPSPSAGSTAKAAAAPSSVPTSAPSASAAPALAPPRVFSFDDDPVDQPPPGFDFARTGGGHAGKWLVKAPGGAASGANVLTQLDADRTEGRSLLAIAAGATPMDVRGSVRCKPISGKVEQACGLAVRVRDEGNYYLASASALEKDVGLYLVKEGRRSQLARWKGARFGDAWHLLALQATGDHLEVFWDGTRVLEANDKALPEAGRVAVWTRADSVTQFDDLTSGPAEAK